MKKSCIIDVWHGPKHATENLVLIISIFSAEAIIWYRFSAKETFEI